MAGFIKPSDDGVWVVHRTVALAVIGLLCAFDTRVDVARAAAPERIIRVAPSGSGLDDRRIAQALQQARALRAKHPVQVRIVLEPGVFRLAAPIQISRADSGTPGRPLIITGAGAGRTVLSGSVPLRPSRSRTLPAGVPPEARAKVRVFALPDWLAPSPRAGVRRTLAREAGAMPFEVFDTTGVLRAARWPNAGWARGRGSSVSRDRVMLPQNAVARWQGEPDLWLSGYIGHDWSFETLPVTAGAKASGVLRLSVPARYAPAAENRVFIANSLAELDAPGEWYLDARRRQLLVWPRETGDLEISRATGAFVFDHAAHVSLSNIAIHRVRGDGIVARKSHDIALSDIGIRWAGGRGIRFDEVSDASIRAADLADLGDGGLLVAGGDRRTLTASNVAISDSRIVRFARLGRTYRAAVELRGVGHRLETTFIADAPHLAISVKGNNHTITRNVITRVVRETSDAGAIYAGRDVTERGHRITQNFLHDIQPCAAMPGFEVKGVYLDDFASGFTVLSNLFVRVAQPVFVGGGRDHLIARNLFIDSQPALSVDARGLRWATSTVRNPDSPLRQAYAAMPTDSAPWRRHYPLLAAFLADAPGEPKRIRVRSNIVIAGDALATEGAAAAAALVRDGEEALLNAGDGTAALRTARDAQAIARHVPQEVRRSAAAWSIPFRALDRVAARDDASAPRDDAGRSCGFVR